MPIHLLVVTRLSRHHQARIEATGVHLHMAEDDEARRDVLSRCRDDIRAVMTIGTIGFSAEEMDALPNLGLICAQGVGFEGVDVQAARERGIVVTHGPGTNAETVADHALGLMLACLRRIPQGDAGLRNGQWQEIRRGAPVLHGRTLGLLGMGNVGRAIARRAHYGFDMPIVYFARQPKADLDWQHESDPKRVAEQADVLVSALPGGPETHHLVDDALLGAMKPESIVVNVGRGSVVDSDALARAVTDKRIAGAALDVFEHEPEVPQALKDEPRIIMTPHTAGLSPSALDATVELVIQNLEAFRDGRAPVTPVSGT
ncbi:2-hydroxyacid dehydrogenase [Kushneria phyllosphaerae]|uniref:2-ketogluconate reductase n=1 Tax=Kushneria phyllosphaerae TaxID=2100822 RepID=A0A2R8CGW3_9GAMM|nr:2-hydroxyacid dehydrogenase [Kushneria phyllosphaerae]SPJ32119.1 2-ketogluconate reductase [Kushneria phyllosphaerae]